MKRLLFTALLVLIVHAVCFGATYYDDPIEIGIGARPSSMGKAFVAVADDPNAMFLNPAGIGRKENWEVTSMSSNYLDEYQYTMFCGLTPTPAGVFGMGYVSSRTGFDVTGGGTSSYNNDALVLSYGKNIDNILPHTYAGATCKYYSKGFTDPINANGTGYNADLGLLYVPEKWVSYGMDLQNVIAGSQVRGNIEPEDMPFNAKIGTSFNWIEHDLTFAIDKDMYVGRSDFPWPMHFGVEWRAHRNLYLRAGLDQVASSADEGNLTNNMTYGIGFEYSGIKIDLAYMQNYAQTDVSSSIISLSLFSQPILAEEKPAEKEVTATAKAMPLTAETIPVRSVAEKIEMVPAGNIMTEDQVITLSGTVEFDITDLWIGGKKLQLRSNRAFASSVPLSIGRNEITIKIMDTKNAEADIIKKVIRFYIPSDISPETAKDLAFEQKVINTEIRGYLGKDYATNKKLSREILALLISKAKKLDTRAPQNDVSTDVKSAYWAAGFINAVRSAGIMDGYSDGTFRPDDLVSRKELAMIMSRVTGMGEDNILSHLASGSPDDAATMKDLADIMFATWILSGEIDSCRDFLGAEVFLGKQAPEKIALPEQKPVPEPVTTEAVPVMAPTPEAAVIRPKSITEKIRIIDPQSGTSTFNSEMLFRGSVDNDVKQLWMNDKSVMLGTNGAFSETVPLAYGRNDLKIRIIDDLNNAGSIIIRIERNYQPKDVTTEEAKAKYIDKAIIQTKVRDYMGKDYSMKDRLTREELDEIIKKMVGVK